MVDRNEKRESLPRWNGSLPGQVKRYHAGSQRSIIKLAELGYDPLEAMVQLHDELRIELEHADETARPKLYDQLINVAEKLLRYGYGRVPELPKPTESAPPPLRIVLADGREKTTEIVARRNEDAEDAEIEEIEEVEVEPLNTLEVTETTVVRDPDGKFRKVAVAPKPFAGVAETMRSDAGVKAMAEARRTKPPKISPGRVANERKKERNERMGVVETEYTEI